MLLAMIQVSMAHFLIPGDLNMRNDLEECQAGLLDCNCWCHHGGFAGCGSAHNPPMPSQGT